MVTDMTLKLKIVEVLDNKCQHMYYYKYKYKELVSINIETI